MKTKIIILFLLGFTNLYSLPLDSVVKYSVTKLDNPEAGYILLGPLNQDGIVCLFDNNADPIYVHKLPPDVDGLAMKLTNIKYHGNGIYSFYANNAGKHYILNESFNIIDSVATISPVTTDFHDLIIKPNGNFLIYGRNALTVDMSKKVQGGKTNAIVSDMVIQELSPNKTLITQWSLYEHIDILQATEDIDLTQIKIDPYHINSIFIDTDSNLIISIRHLDQILKLTWPEGKILWRIGGSAAKANDFTFINDTWNGFTGFSHQHDAKLLPNGNLLLFDNGKLKGDKPFSRVVEYNFNVSAKTLTKVWEFIHPDSIFSQAMGNAQRLPNGNTFIGWGGADGGDHHLIATECRPDGSIAFDMQHPSKGSYRAFRLVLKKNALTYNIKSTGTYDFNDATNKTGVALQLTNITGSGFTSVERHDYSPHNLAYSSTAPCVIVNKRFVINNKGITSIQGKISIKLSELNNPSNPNELIIYQRSQENSGNFSPLTTTLNSSLAQLEASINGFGEFLVAFSTNTGYPIPAISIPMDRDSGVSTSPMLIWLRNGMNELYHIQISTSSNFDSLVLDTNNLEENRIIVNNLNDFTKYYWRVKAFTSTCTSAWSEPFSFTTHVAAPMLSVPGDKQNDIPIKSLFSWSPSTGATQYRIQIADSANMLNPIRDINLDAANTSTTIDNLKYFTKYFWRVSALNGTQSGPWSPVWSFTTVKLTAALVSPSNLATGQQINGTLIWKDNGPGCYYRVQVATDSIFRNIVMDESGLNTNSANYKDFNYITDYYWRVKAETSESKSEWTPHWKFRTIIHTPELLSPKQSAKSINVNSFLACALIKGATNYEVELAKDSLFKNVIFTKTANEGFFKFSNLDYETSYYWHVRVYDNNTPGEWSPVWSFKTLKSGQIASPDPVYPFIRSNSIPQKFDFKWESVSNADKYNIQLSSDSVFSNIIFDQSDITDIFVASPQLSYNTKYYWRAKACKSSDCSEWTDIADFYVCLESVVLFMPENNAVDMPVNLFLAWDNAPGAKLYQMQIAKDSLFNDIAIDQNNLKKAQANAEQLASSTVYYWRVRSFNQQNGSLWSEIRSFKTEKSTGVDDQYKEVSFISPNPATDFINVFVGAGSEPALTGDVKIYNVFGQIQTTPYSTLALTASGEGVRIDVSGLAPGMYFVRIGDRVGKFVKL